MSTVKAKSITTEKEAVHFVSLYDNNLKDVPRKLMTKKVCDIAFEQNPYSSTYSWIPEKHRTFAMFLKASPDYGPETKDFAECHMQSEWGISVSAFVALKKKGTLPHFRKDTPKEVINICYAKAFSENPGVITSMPKELIPKILKSPFNVNKVIGHSPDNGSYFNRNSWRGAHLIKFIPEVFMTNSAIEFVQEKLKQEAEAGRSGSFFDIDSKYVTDDLYELLLEKSPTSLESIPEDRKTQVMCDIAVKKDGRAIKAVPQEWKSELYADVVKSGKGLYEIPEEDRTDRLCTLAVEEEASQFQYVPQDKKTYALSLQAVDVNAEMIEFVPTELLDEEMITRLVISIFRKNWEHDFSLCELPEYKKEKGQTEPILSTVFNSFFEEEEGGYKRTKEMKKIINEVISREGKLYFAMLDFSGENDENSGRRNFNQEILSHSGRWSKYFKDVAEFNHAIIAARADIEVVSGFKQDVQARVWKEFLNNNK